MKRQKSPARHARKEHEAINNYLNALVKCFADFKPDPKTLATDEAQIALCFRALNQKWKTYCNQTFQFHEPPADAFEKRIEKEMVESDES